MINPLIEFQFQLEPGASDSEIEALWNNCQQAQIAMDRFLEGRMNEYELHDYLLASEVDPNETLETMEANAMYLGLILP